MIIIKIQKLNPNYAGLDGVDYKTYKINYKKNHDHVFQHSHG